MKKFLKILFWSAVTIIVLLAGAMSLFVYKVKNGFPVSFETEKPELTMPAGKPAVLLFSKTTGFRHSGSIDTSKGIIKTMADKNGWHLHETEAGGIFNNEQLSKFKVVIFNNSTGRVLNDNQQQALEQYVENGGTLIGIHGAGDDSHHWNWYEENLLGARFSHHAIQLELQLADVNISPTADSSLRVDMPSTWNTRDEWYVFFNQPKGVTVLSHIDGTSIDPSGNILWVKEKSFGMGKTHPVAWYKTVGKGKTFYTSMGHAETAWRKAEYRTMIENAIRWGIR